jgi:hypothetical protein
LVVERDEQTRNAGPRAAALQCAARRLIEASLSNIKRDVPLRRFTSAFDPRAWAYRLSADARALSLSNGTSLAANGRSIAGSRLIQGSGGIGGRPREYTTVSPTA